MPIIFTIVAIKPLSFNQIGILKINNHAIKHCANKLMILEIIFSIRSNYK